MILTTTEAVSDQRILRTLGLVRGNTVRARHIGRDMAAVFRNIVGGEVREYSELLAQAREEALERMAKRAEALGANAVVGIRFGTAAIMGGAAEILAYGTAVVVEEVGQ
ncbi:MAG: YbjQ family protein [Chloroflexi bacterium]|nr:YbjQ family protein [Chloroflexota bacterium]